MVKPSRLSSRNGVDCGTPSTRNSGERPRSVSPAPDSFWRVGEKDGIRVATVSTAEAPSAVCWAIAASSMSSTVLGMAERGSWVRAAVTTTSSSAVTCGAVWAMAVPEAAEHRARALVAQAKRRNMEGAICQ